MEPGSLGRIGAGVAPGASGTRDLPLETFVNRAFVFGIGLLLPVLTLRTQYKDEAEAFERIALVDILCAAFLTILFFRHRMVKPPLAAFFYLVAIPLALIPALLVTPGPEWDVWVAFAAMLMAFGFYLVGLNVGASRVLLRWFLAGYCVAVFAEGIIVYHDLLTSSMWFPDNMKGRVRGTFKFNGQLGAYGFGAAATLATFGATLASPRFRKVCVAGAILAASFVIPASRRTGMLSLFVWGALFTLLGWRFAGKRFYSFFVGAFLIALLLLGIFWPQVEASFAGQRFNAAVSSIQAKEGFIQNQFRQTLETASDWFPFGFGVGRGNHIDRHRYYEIHYEVHNSFLAVLVELGLLGFVGYLGMVIHPLLKRRWQVRSLEHSRLGLLLTTFLLVSILFMCHNTLYRDRPFLIFLGIATTIVRRESRPGVASGLFRR